MTMFEAGKRGHRYKVENSYEPVSLGAGILGSQLRFVLKRASASSFYELPLLTIDATEPKLSSAHKIYAPSIESRYLVSHPLSIIYQLYSDLIE